MSFLNPYFVSGLFLLLYLSSFVVLAIIRIATGISIQRCGYFSLKRIAYTPNDGVQIAIRGLGLVLHRPTFAQPTWVSLRVTELKVTVDVRALGRGTDAAGKPPPEASRGAPLASIQPKAVASKSPQNPSRISESTLSRSRLWKRLTQVKDRIKQLHHKIHWLCLVDVEALKTILVITEICSFELGRLTVAVDTRRKTVDRGRLFQHKKVPADDQRPVEWIFTVKSVLFTLDGDESLEVLDICTLNVHGLLYRELAGLRDASISLKLGRIHIPYDELLACKTRIAQSLVGLENHTTESEDTNSFTDVIEEWGRPGSTESEIVQTVSDSKEFVSSILRGIQEIQMAISFVGLTKAVESIQPAGSPLFLNVAINEFGVDMYRLDPKSPAHRMYFSSKDIAHQALLAGISIGISLDDGIGKPERIFYVPMATMTVKTTLPSKTLVSSKDEDADERNANILFANLVVTSPSIDVDPKHVPLILALVQARQARPKAKFMGAGRHHLISRLLPKANIKVSVHEPVVRVALPPANVKLLNTDEYDMLICSISSISLDVESSHASGGKLHYALSSNLRISANQLYYYTASGERHNLLTTDTFELKVQVTASPDVSVVASGDIKTFSVHMIRPEISGGVRQIVQQLSKKIDPDSLQHSKSSTSRNFLRSLPRWLVQFQLQGSNFGVDIASVDYDVSTDTRGISLQLESWTAEYNIQRDIELEKPRPRRRKASKLSITEEPSIKIKPPTGLGEKTSNTTDARRLTMHVRGLEGFIVEGMDHVESESLISLPRFEVAFSTSSDSHGPIFHLNSYVKALHIQYSLYRYYAVGVAFSVLRKAFFFDMHSPSAEAAPCQQPSQNNDMIEESASNVPMELFCVDVKIEMLQVKGTMPADPPMMLQVFGLEAGRHRWAVPFLKSRLVRLYAEAPQVRSAWARIVTLKNLRVDLRENRRKTGRIVSDERSVDVTTELIRVGVPHQLVIHQIFDNFANILKATEQLHHRFKTGTNEYILKKRPGGPKKVPRISLRSKTMLFELDDGPFEWKLGSIYRTGLIEQKQRLARQEAFVTKVRNMEEVQQHRGSSRYRTHTSYTLQRNEYAQHQDCPNRNEASESPRRERFSSPLPSKHRHNWRYDPDGKCSLTGSAKISAEEAWLKLQEYNAQSWKKRIDGTYKLQSNGMKEIRALFWGKDEVPDMDMTPEKILCMPERPGLMSTLISDLHIVIEKPSFPIGEYPKFLHKVGKGMPLDMDYTLVIPLSVQIDMGEARVTLRDYPLPLIHVPANRPGQSPRLPSWSLKTDFVIAEEWRGSESTKHVQVEVIPAEKFSDERVKGGFDIDVRRTVAPVKTYSDVEIIINSGAPTSITWGPSYQPAIQNMMMIIEGFTKPQVDPSDRCGFWDKIRLSVHSRVNVMWKGDGDVHLKLKGSRDPYVVTGHGAGFVMCWRNDVRWGIHQDDDPKQFMTVKSGEYVLAIPDYSHQARETISGTSQDSESISSTSSYKNGALFKKVIMKLSGNVRWMAGIVFERDLDQGGRSFQFVPHYNVILRTQERAHALQQHVRQIDPGILSALTRCQGYDAFKGFRSNHIHLSIAIVAPLDRDWSIRNAKASSSYNAVHLTPRFFTHFFDWWSLFSGAMSLPIRQGTLFPGIEKASKKFGRHLATIKYNLLLSPLFIAHMYKHKDAEEYAEEVVSATGLKLRIDSFMLDLHQRREEFPAQGKWRGKQVRTSGMRINQAQLDFVAADVRAVSASITGTTTDAVKHATNEELASYQEPASGDMSRFTIPDNDFSWIDMDDFVELDWNLPAESNPQTKIMPLAYAPRFTYFRQTDHAETPPKDGIFSPFGNEPTHLCVMSHDNDPRRVQCGLIRDRISRIDEHLELHQRRLGEQELRVVRDSNRNGSLKESFQLLSDQGILLKNNKEYLQQLLAHLEKRLQENKSWRRPNGDTAKDDFDMDGDSDGCPDAEGDDGIERTPLSGLISDFNNRFIIHNIQLKWNNSLRNIILRYVHQVSQRRGFVYYMSRRAVKFILDIVQEQSKSKQKSSDDTSSASTEPGDSPKIVIENQETEGSSIEQRIQELLNDAKKFVHADDPSQAETTEKPISSGTDEDISQSFTPVNSYHVRLVAPQIQLQSEKHSKSIVLVTAKSMQLKVIQIMDKDRMTDDVSGLVQRRFFVDMDSVQFFTTNQKDLIPFIHLYSGNGYGTPKGSAWPPWVPFEVNFDFKLCPYGWSRVVQKTSASLRYEKYNTLRLKFNDDVNSGSSSRPNTPENFENRMDKLSVNFPQFKAICDSSQYYTMYIIVLDLLLYNEPLEKVRSERLEKIMLASDFSDLRGAPEMVTSLQGRIQQLEEIKTHFQIHAKYLDRQGWLDRLSIEQDLASCEDELFFMMKALTNSQRKSDDRGEASQNNGLLQWHLSASQIVWHLMRAKAEPLIEIRLQNAAYHRTDNSDGSNHNTMEIERVHGLNCLPNAIYPDMLAPFAENGKEFIEGDGQKMLKVHWHMLEAIAGIPVLSLFEVNLFPLKIQLEREVGKQLFEYIFPGANTDNGNRSPFMVRNIPAAHDKDWDSDAEIEMSPSDQQGPDGNVSSDNEHTDNQPGSLERRLRPTKALTEGPRSNGTTSGETHSFRLFRHSNSSQTGSKPSIARAITKRQSRESLLSSIRPSHDTSSASLSMMNGNMEKHRKFGLARSGTRDNFTDNQKKPPDDLTLMMSRASEYMTLAYVKIPSVVLCLSYKGRGERNFEDVHDFVFRMPVLEYRNKTWSNLDLAVRLKKDVIKALISHTGAIIGNKFSHHRPNRQHQRSRLRELSTAPSMRPTSSSTVASTNASDTSSTMDHSPVTDKGESPIESRFAGLESTASSTRSSLINNGNHVPESPTVEELEANAAAAADAPSQGFIRNHLIRRFANDSQAKSGKKDSSYEDPDESTRKKSVVLIGQKILGSLN